MLVAHDVPHTLRGTRQSDQPHHHAVFVEAGRSRSAVRVLPGQVNACVPLLCGLSCIVVCEANVQLVAASSSSPALSSAVQVTLVWVGISHAIYHICRTWLAGLVSLSDWLTFTSVFHTLSRQMVAQGRSKLLAIEMQLLKAAGSSCIPRALFSVC